MNLVIPMAGMGKRMRPSTLTTPKPLLPIAGKPIVHRLVEDITKVCGQPVEAIGFVIARAFGSAVEQELKDIAASVGAKGEIFYQDEALGTAHAVLCAKDILKGNTVVAFADTLFKADFVLDAEQEGIIWVKQVKDPSAFGVVQLNDNNEITGFVEKPTQFVSDLAIIGIYYFKDGGFLKDELQYLIDNDVKVGTEYQLTDALSNMQKKGTRFYPGQVTDWLDCGNKEATLTTNETYLGYIGDQNLIADSASIENSSIGNEVFIGENVIIKDSTVRNGSSIGDNSVIENCVINRSLIQKDCQIKNINIDNSMLGNSVILTGEGREYNLSDFSVVE